MDPEGKRRISAASLFILTLLSSRHPSSFIHWPIYFCVNITNYLLMSQVGAQIYAKATFIVFIVVLLVLASIFISFFIVGPREIVLPPSAVVNGTAQTVANYTGIRLHTLKSNLLRKCQMCSQMCSQQCCGLTICNDICQLAKCRDVLLTSIWNVSNMPLLISLFSKLVTRWTIQLVPSCVLSKCLPSCSMAALESWQDPTCRVRCFESPSSTLFMRENHVCFLVFVSVWFLKKGVEEFLSQDSSFSSAIEKCIWVQPVLE